jgi:autotransporter translocation and assembly factor TamB
MKSRSLALFALVIGIGAMLISGAANAQAQEVKGQDVKLESPDFQVVLDQLFGSATSDGLLQGTRHFELRAENVVMTPEQADMFFVPSSTNPADISDLIAKAEAIKGAELKISGSVDGAPFDLKLSGKQVKAEGLVLTQAEFDALILQLQATTGLHEAKIEATVDGQLKVAKLENVAGRVKIENRDFHGKDPHPVPHVEPLSDKSKPDARGVSGRPERPDHDVRPEKIEKIERPEKVERIERPEKIERVERPEKVERIERPEVAQSGKGRG